jgi:hypothetical protein
LFLPALKQGVFPLKFTVKFTLSVWHFIGKNKNIFLSLCSLKMQDKLDENYKTAHMLKKFNLQLQTQ